MITMKKLLIFTLSCFFICSTWAIAESNLVDIPAAELLDVYQKDQKNSTTTKLQEPAAPVEQGSPELANEEAVEFRRVESADGTEIYEVIPAQSASPQVVTTDDEVQQSQELEVIELESYNEEVITVDVQESNKTNVASTTKSVHAFCQQNPLAKECLYSKYLSLCKKDPQSADCQSQLEKFENYCNTFPRAYKCKKAQLAATCKQQPHLNECKSMTQRYCQKYPKAIFCNWN